MTHGKLWLFLSLIFMAAALAGCGAKEKKKEAERLLEEKYGEAFTVTSYKGYNLGDTYYTVTAYSDDWPTLPFEAHPSLDGSGVTDGYAGRRVCRKVSDLVSENLAGVMPCSVYVHTVAEPADSICPDPDVSVEEFAGTWMPDSRFHIYVHIDNRDWEDVDISGYLQYAMAGLSTIEGSLTVCFSDADTMALTREYVETHTGLGESFFHMLDRRKVRRSCHGTSGGRVLNLY